jgi:Flp pilus assembly protein CpaB
MSTVATVIVSTRRVLARRPWIQWAVIVVVATLAAASVHGRLQRVDAERDSWGVASPVLVATGPIEVGEPLRVEKRQLPSAIVPEGAIYEADGLVARQRIGNGEIITDVDVVSDSGPQAMTPNGWLAVPVVESPRSGAALGDHVQVASDGFVLSSDAIVVGSFDEVTVLAVPADEAPLLPAANDAGSLTLLLKP